MGLSFRVMTHKPTNDQGVMVFNTTPEEQEPFPVMFIPHWATSYVDGNDVDNINDYEPVEPTSIYDTDERPDGLLIW